MKAHFLLPRGREPINICRHGERERWRVVIGPNQGDLDQLGPFPLRSILYDDLGHKASSLASWIPTWSPKTVVRSLPPAGSVSVLSVCSWNHLALPQAPRGQCGVED